MACIDCKYSVESQQIMKFYCMNNYRNKNTDREERYKSTQGIDCPYCTLKEGGGEK
jgi:DNA-directed RNA polymerase subunit RPC12/RpoP